MPGKEYIHVMTFPTNLGKTEKEAKQERNSAIIEKLFESRDGGILM